MLTAFWHKYIKKGQPWADLVLENGKITVRDWNQAFINKLRTDLGTVADGKTDIELVKAYVSRENLEHEEPKLDVVHSGISEDGRIKMKLDWNRAFIDMLAKNGISAETEEQAVEMYLSMITKNAEQAVEAQEVGPALNEFVTTVDEEYQQDMQDIQKLLQKSNRKLQKLKRAQK